MFILTDEALLLRDILKVTFFLHFLNFSCQTVKQPDMINPLPKNSTELQKTAKTLGLSFLLKCSAGLCTSYEGDQKQGAHKPARGTSALCDATKD